MLLPCEGVFQRPALKAIQALKSEFHINNVMKVRRSNLITNFSRRKFLGAAGTLSAFSFIPRHVLGEPGKPSPNDKLNIACIGCGLKGYDHVRSITNENTVALCERYLGFNNHFNIAERRSLNPDATILFYPNQTRNGAGEDNLAGSESITTILQEIHQPFQR